MAHVYGSLNHKQITQSLCAIRTLLWLRSLFLAYPKFQSTPEVHSHVTAELIAGGLNNGISGSTAWNMQIQLRACACGIEQFDPSRSCFRAKQWQKFLGRKTSTWHDQM